MEQAETRSASLERAAEHWGDEATTWEIGRGLNWLELPQVRRRIFSMISGDANVDFYQWLRQSLAADGVVFPLERVLTLGCGTGGLERRLFALDFARSYEGIDLAEGAIAQAQEAAAAMPAISYRAADINAIELPTGAYDAIFCHMSAHHFENLEGIFAAVFRALKPGGRFLLEEYIGPRRFQWPASQGALIDGLLKLMPERLRRAPDGHIRTRFEAMEEAALIAVDPSEAIRSDEILPVLQQSFAVTRVRGYGGNILQNLLHQIGVNFIDETDGEAQAWLSRIFAVEDWNLNTRPDGHDHAIIVAARPDDVGLPPGLHDPSWNGATVGEAAAGQTVMTAWAAHFQALNEALLERDAGRHQLDIERYRGRECANDLATVRGWVSDLETRLRDIHQSLVTVSVERDSLICAREELTGDRNALIVERDAMKVDRDAVARDRDALAATRDAALQERDAVIGERNRLDEESRSRTGERDAARAAVEALAAENAGLTGELAASRGQVERHALDIKDLTARLEAVHRSTSWRLTQPLRWLVGLAGRRV